MIQDIYPGTFGSLNNPHYSQPKFLTQMINFTSVQKMIQKMEGTLGINR